MMYLDGIKTYKSGTWQRAILHVWSGTGWSVKTVVPMEGNYSMDYNNYNLNAKSVVKIYKPTWFAQYNDSLQYYDKVSSNGTGSFKVGRWYDTYETYTTIMGLPTSQMKMDSIGKFGIAKIEMRSTVLSVGGYGFGRCWLNTSDATTMPNLYDPYLNVNEQFMTYLTINMTEEHSQSFNAYFPIMEGLMNDEFKSIVMQGEYDDTRVCYEVKDVEFVVTWASIL